MSQNTDRRDSDAQIAALRAAEAELTDGPDAALKALGPLTDAVRIKAALGILVRADRLEQAADLIRHHSPDAKWIDLAAFVFSSLGDRHKAHGYLGEADSYPDRIVAFRTRLGFAEGTLNRLNSKLGREDSVLTITAWSHDDATVAQDAAASLEPIISLVRSQNAIDGELQLHAVVLGVYVSHIQHDVARLKEYTAWLVEHRPIPLIVADLCLLGHIALPTGLVTRIRLEHPNQFHAGLLAAIIERDLLHLPDDAFDALATIAPLASSDSEKNSICLALVEVAGSCSVGRIDQALSFVQSIAPDNQRLLNSLAVARHIAVDDLPSARKCLDATRDEEDALWWQAHAQVCEREGDEANAQLAWEQASQRLPHPMIVRRSVQASLKRRSYESAVRGLKALLVNAPDSASDLHALSAALIQLGDFAEAARYLEQLVRLDSADIVHRVAFAQCLARSAQITRAIDVLAQSPDGSTLPLHATLIHSELLHAAGRPEEALSVLDRVAANHQDAPHFLMTYIARAHAASKEEAASKAFIRLEELRRGGHVAPDLMQVGTLEQLLEYGREYQSRRETLQSQIVDGRVPWLFVEDVLGNPPLWAWILHTQRLQWLPEDKTSRAAFTIYATNGFFVGNGGLERIETASPATEVVVDISALVTLFQIGRLESAADYFGHLLLPATYGDLYVRDATRYGQHQPSREAELQALRREIDAHNILVMEGESQLPTVDEYSDLEGTRFYRLADLAGPLKATQRLADDAFNALAAVTHKPSAAQSGSQPLSAGDALLFDLATIRTLVSQAAFRPILEIFRVHLLAADIDKLSAELGAHAEARAARQKHDALWDVVTRLIQEGKMKWMPVPKHGASDIDDSDPTNDDSLPSVHGDALTVATTNGYPLMVDDRVLQVAAIQREAGRRGVAFGVDRVLEAMAVGDDCEVESAANNFHSLMLWRYRFLIPPPAFLVSWARAHMESLPGNALLDTASYLHDCLRDPGLHCGFEATSPPLPMAAKFVTAWLDTIVAFLASVWGDDSFSDEAAGRLTTWAGKELIPSCPRGLVYHQVGLNIASAESRSLLGMACVKFTIVPSRIRANTGLRTLAATLGMDDREYFRTVAEAIDAVRQNG